MKETEIRRLLHKIGMSAHLKGYQYVLVGIQYLSENPGVLQGKVTKKLYPYIADACDTIPSRVERAVRHAIEAAWMRNDPREIEEIFGNSISPTKGKPTNAEFFAMMVEKLYIDSLESEGR